MWDAATGKCLRTFVESGDCLKVLAGHAVGVINAVWSADGRLAFSCDWRGEVRGWKASAATA